MANAQKKQEKLLEKEREKRERRIMKEKVKTYDGGFMSRCVAVLIGFIFGIVGTIGGIAGGGYYFAKKKTIRETADSVGDLAGKDFDITKYLSDEYADQTLIEFFKNISSISSKFTDGEASLATISEVTPYAQTVAEKLTEALAKFGLEVTTDGILNTSFTDYSSYLQDSLKASKLSALIGVEPNGSLLSLLCFGEEGVNYTIDSEGNVVMLDGSKQLTVGDFTDNGATTDLFYRISLKAVMSTNENASFDDPIVRAVLYGTKGVDYITETTANPETGETGETIVMLPLSYTYEDDGTGAFSLKNDHDDIIDSALYSVDPSSGVIALFSSAPESEDDAPSSYLAKDESDGKYYAYKTREDLEAGLLGDESKRVLHKATTLGDVTAGDFAGMFEGVKIADLLNVTAESEAATRTIAYGSEGKDYKIEDGKIVMLGGAKPRTLKDLKNGNDLISSMYLKDILGVTPENGNDTVIALAYGKEGKNYIYDKSTKTVTMLKKTYTARYILPSGAGVPVLTLFNDDGVKVTDETATGAYDSASNEWHFDGAGTNSGTYTAKKAENSLGKYTYHIYSSEDESSPVTYDYRTISDLTNLDSQELLGGITLRSALKINAADSSADPILIALAYGTQGVAYELSKDSSTGDTIVTMKPIAYTASYDSANGAYVWKNENGESVVSSAVNGSAYEFIRTENGVSRYVYAQNVAGAGEYALCDAFGNSLTYEERTISSLKSANAKEVFNGIELRTILSEDKNDKINLYLLYGKEAKYNAVSGQYENGNYYIDAEGNVALLGKPNTIADLRAGGENSLISKIRTDLTIGDILGESANDNKILKHITDATLDNLGLKINELKITDVFESDIYETDGAGNKTMKAEWSYLLHDPDRPGESPEYTINDMSALMDNMKKNIRTKSVADLNRDFALELNETFLATPLDPAVAGKEGVVGDLTMSELTDYIPLLIAKLQTSGS